MRLVTERIDAQVELDQVAWLGLTARVWVRVRVWVGARVRVRARVKARVGVRARLGLTEQRGRHAAPDARHHQQRLQLHAWQQGGPG